MSEAKESAIKLFGKTIPVQEIAAGSVTDSSGASFSACGAEEDDSSAVFSLVQTREGEERGVDKDTSKGKVTKKTQKDGSSPLPAPDCAQISENPKTPSINNDTTTLKSSKTEDDNSDTSVSEEKTLKKPDKIIPCPRCKSMDTKFCYYNNYNVNQPRHFCKNCQRYWTAGGTMRSVPVGAGRRKNKNSNSLYPRHIILPEPLQSTTNDVPNKVITFNKLNHQSSSTDLNMMQEPPLVPSFPGALCPYPWPTPVFYPIPVYGAPTYWGWNIPLIQQPSSGPNLSLGKRSRDEEVISQQISVKEDEEPKESSSKKCLWAPKTLRINDPKEAAKSSIWETLGIKNESKGSIGGKGLFKAFQVKGSIEKSHEFKSSSVLQANPAALGRSVSFHESS